MTWRFEAKLVCDGPQVASGVHWCAEYVSGGPCRGMEAAKLETLAWAAEQGWVISRLAGTALCPLCAKGKPKETKNTAGTKGNRGIDVSLIKVYERKSRRKAVSK